MGTGVDYRHRDPRVSSKVALALCLLFVCLAIPWIGRPGMQTDETLFASAIYPPIAENLVIRIFDREIPLMTMSYVGALKSYLWAGLFQIWEPSPASVRIPAVVLGALSVWWMYGLLRRTVGTHAALAGAALLATDPLYILYSRWDHGPVVLQHLCLLGAMLALVRFHQERGRKWLALGFFALGLGVWEKAVFVWLIGGFGLAGMIVFYRPVRAALSLRHCAIAMASFSFGALPLIIFNARYDLITFRSNTQWSSEGFTGKAALLRKTMEGSALFGSIIRDPWDGPARAAESAGERAVEMFAESTGLRRKSLMAWLAVAAVLLLPFAWRTPARSLALFVLICGAVAWLQMALTKNAGTGAHHTILLWPLPTMAIAGVLAWTAERFRRGRLALAMIVSAACLSNLMVLGTYYTNMFRYGGTSSWTDAMYPALASIRTEKKKAVCTVDWGFLDTLRLYEQGRTSLCLAGDPRDEEGRRTALFQISRPGYLFLTHTAGNETVVGSTARFVAFAEENGYQQTNHRVFRDSNGRPTVETFQFAAQ